MIILTLQNLDKGDVTLVGGKAASLGKLLKAKTLVPPGFVITTEAYKKYFREGLPVKLRDEIFNAFDNLGAQKVAVRSSAVAEDSSTASWAGQLESYLNVARDDLIDRIHDCWNSIHSERALAYAGRLGISEEELLVGVVIQKMVNSEISGVMFTVNPVNKDVSELMIEAAPGLGEAIVQGAVTPDNFVLDKKTLKIKSKALAAGSELSDNKLKAIAKLGVEIENRFGSPQDIEWALEKRKIYILQSRPITTLARPQTIGEDPPFFRRYSK